VLGVKTDADKKAYGGFAKFGILNRIAILSEVDFVENTRLSNMTRGLYGFGELSIIIVKGLEFRSQYEYMKPDRDAGNNRITRKSIGAAVYPLAGLETEAMIRFVTEDTQPNTNEFQVNFHFYF